MPSSRPSRPTPTPSRSEIWLANLDPPHGTEPGKTRPVLVVQAQALSTAGHPSTLVVPLTTNVVEDAEPLRLRVPTAAGLSRASDLLIDQLRAIDNRRLVKGPVARLGADFMARVGVALCEVLDIS
jgi:mRNA interferase MazF